jgi:hypothetical protein
MKLASKILMRKNTKARKITKLRRKTSEYKSATESRE